MNLEIGTQLGDYRIVSRIGQGSYGVVFEAEHVITRRIDAVKFLHDAGPGSADDEQRFLQEIQVQARLHHPNIATVHTAFRTPWGLALAMEKVPGEPLSAILKRGRPPLQEGVRYILATLSALHCAERFGIVHRDIKPDNILITPEGQVKITDFGLAQIRGSARITSSGESLGTPCYMAPEQVVGTNPVDGRTDIYSTGVVLYEIVTGRPPFQASNGFAVMMAHQNTQPIPPAEIDPAIGWPLSGVITAALQKSPERRFQNAAQFHEALTQAMPGAPASLAPLSAGVLARGHARIAALVACGCMCLGGLMMWAARLKFREANAVARPAVSAPVRPAAISVSVPEVPVESVRAPVESLPATPGPLGQKAPAGRQLRRRRATMEQAVSPAPVEPERPKLDRAAVRPAGSDVSPLTAEPPKVPDLVPEIPAQPFEPPAALPPASAPAAKVKKPSVLKRAITKIFGKRDKHATPETESSPQEIKQD
jgi:serine/threonine-protein kinase